MSEFFGSIFWLVVALGLLVTFHEFGHYWVARRNGVRVLRFSVGFGRPLMRRTSRDGVEFVLAAIPLGGYVKMLDEREAEVAPQDRHAAFNRQSIGARAAIVAAGPVFNLIFAIAAFWAMFMIGVPETRPVLGPVEGLAAEAGLRPDDLIVEVDGDRVATWTHAVLELMPAALDRRAVTIAVEDLDGVRRETWIALDRLGPEFREEHLLQSLGLRPWQADLPPVIGEVSAESAADRAGIEPGDRIVSIDGVEIDGWLTLVEQIPEAAAGGAALRLVVERAGQTLELELVADQVDGRPVIGVRPPPPGPELQAAFDRTFTVLRHGPIEALGSAVGETWRLTSATFGMLGRMVTGSASLSNLSGPVTIAQMAKQSANLGLTRFLFFLGLISLSLAIINVLPIPVLDGGHLLYLLIEWIKGSPVSEQGQSVGQSVGLLMILALMSLAVFNDILRLVQ